MYWFLRILISLDSRTSKIDLTDSSLIWLSGPLKDYLVASGTGHQNKIVMEEVIFSLVKKLPFLPDICKLYLK